MHFIVKNQTFTDIFIQLIMLALFFSTPLQGSIFADTFNASHKVEHAAYEKPDNIHIFAAASLTGILKKIHQNLSIDQKKINAVLATGPSGTIARQISAGAPADIFISANIEWIDFLKDQNLLTGTPYIIAENKLVLASPHNWEIQRLQPNSKLFHTFLKSANLLAVADPKISPLGRYSVSYMRAKRVWDTVKSNIAYANNARQTLALIERGNMPGFIYHSSAVQSKRVKIIATLNITGKIQYYGVILKNSNNQTRAKKYLEAIQSSTINKSWQAFGFTPSNHD
jgi:molybdate transport system substrate-binding protein